MIPRTLQGAVRRAVAQYPVVTVTGPRQSGKTTLLRNCLRSHEYASLEDPDLRASALRDPRGFLDQFEGKVVLDEVQRAPELFSYIQTRVDGSDDPGRYVLSGSHNFLLMRSVSQSLAGRCAVLHLLPFSLSELEGRTPLDHKALGQRVPPRIRWSERDLMETLWTGFYPRIHDKNLDAREWLRNYAHTYIERDVREVLNVGDLGTFDLFLRLCAGRNGQLLNLSSLASDAGITHTTARRWLSTLEASFLVTLLRPHHRNFRKRLVKNRKLYFLDSGLVCYLLGIQSPAELRVHSSRGSLFEGFVLAELLKSAYHRGEDPNLFFWRDFTGHEVDILVDLGGRQIPVEIKSGRTVASDFLAGIDYWRRLAGEESGPAALVYGGDRSYRERGVVVQSWATL